MAIIEDLREDVEHDKVKWTRWFSFSHRNLNTSWQSEKETRPHYFVLSFLKFFSEAQKKALNSFQFTAEYQAVHNYHIYESFRSGRVHDTFRSQYFCPSHQTAVNSTLQVIWIHRVSFKSIYLKYFLSLEFGFEAKVVMKEKDSF